MMHRHTSVTLWPLWIVIAAAMAVCAMVMTGCAGQSARHGQPGVLFETVGCRIYPDSMVFDNGMTVRALGDSILQVRLDGITLRQMSVPQQHGEALRLRSPWPLLDALVRREGGMSIDASSRSLYLCAMLNPLDGGAVWKDQLAKRTVNGYPVPPETSMGTWPVVNDNPFWLATALECVVASGNERCLMQVADGFRRILDEDIRMCLNQSTGLFYGVPRYFGNADGLMPEWMQPADLFQCQTFGLNMAYVMVLKSAEKVNNAMARRNDRPIFTLPFDADTLEHSVKRLMWQPQRGCFSALVYGWPVTPVAADVSDNLAQAMAVAFDVISGPMAMAMVAKSGEGDGQRLFTPAPEGAMERESADTRLAMVAQCIAAARVGNENLFNARLASIVKRLGEDVLSGRTDFTALAPVSAVLLRGVAGTDFRWDNLQFHPFLPEWACDGCGVEFVWRKKSVRVHVAGAGKMIAACESDGHPSEPVIDASGRSTGSLEINLRKDGGAGAAEPSPEGDGEPRCMLPDVPIVEWVSPAKASVAASPGGASGEGFRVYANGVVVDDISGNGQIEIHGRPDVQWIQVAAVGADGLAGFSARPHECSPQGLATVVDLASVVPGGSRILSDKHLAERFVESSRVKNRNIRFEVIAPVEGRYTVDVHYVSGLGIVNPRRSTALRMCVVNGHKAGVFVFPQCTPAQWDRNLGDNWQRLTSMSNPIVVELRKGSNEIELRYFQTTPVYLDPTFNDVVVDFVRLLPMKSGQPHQNSQNSRASFRKREYEKPILARSV